MNLVLVVIRHRTSRAQQALPAKTGAGSLSDRTVLSRGVSALMYKYPGICFRTDFAKKLRVDSLDKTKYRTAEHGIVTLETPTGEHPSTTLRENCWW